MTYIDSNNTCETVNNRKQSNVTAVVILGHLKVQLMEFFTCTGTLYLYYFCIIVEKDNLIGHLCLCVGFLRNGLSEILVCREQSWSASGLVKQKFLKMYDWKSLRSYCCCLNESLFRSWSASRFVKQKFMKMYDWKNFRCYGCCFNESLFHSNLCIYCAVLSMLSAKAAAHFHSCFTLTEISLHWHCREIVHCQIDSHIYEKRGS